jgi:crotonobetainyl-CoA:carnitine CoA-transferase CaiB-like acyl-CoA transferase
MVEEVLSTKTCDEWVAKLVQVGVPCGPVNNMQSLFADPQVHHRNMIAEVAHPTIGTLRLAGIPIKYAETPASVRLAPPTLGQHTNEILAAVLGYSPEQIEAARQQGAI